MTLHTIDCLESNFLCDGDIDIIEDGSIFDMIVYLSIPQFLGDRFYYRKLVHHRVR
jgi:hypothetical protein